MNTDRQSGFTLIEVVVSIAIMSILMTAVGSLMVFSAKALPNPNDPASMAIKSGTAINRFADDVREAAQVSVAELYAFEVTVGDRDAAGGPDTVRYEWSGVVGEPLVRTYNADRHEILLEQVDSMQFEYETQPSDFPPHVLMVVADPASMSPAENQRQALFESWGFTVSTIDDEAAQDEFDTAVANATVAYICEEALAANVASKLTDATCGVVTEEGRLYDELGISLSWFAYSDGRIDITDNTHAVTSGLPTGLVRIVDNDGGLMITTGTITAGLNILAEQPSSLNPALGVMETGSSRAIIGGTQTGRRVKLPWGNTSEFDFNELTADGQTIMRQSVEWASAHDVVTSVRLTINGVSGSTWTTQRRVQLINHPREPTP